MSPTLSSSKKGSACATLRCALQSFSPPGCSSCPLPRKLLTSSLSLRSNPCLTEPVPAGRGWLSQHTFAHHPPDVLSAAPNKEEWCCPVQSGAQGEREASLARAELGNHGPVHIQGGKRAQGGPPPPPPPPQFRMPSHHIRQPLRHTEVLRQRQQESPSRGPAPLLSAGS